MQIIDGILTFKGVGGKDVLLEEMCLDDYEQFFKHWIVMFQLLVAATEGEGDDAWGTVADAPSFFDLLATNLEFREATMSALILMGVKDPGKTLLPRNVYQLFMGDKDTPIGWIFKLHNTSPKISAQRVEKEPPKRPSGSQSTSNSLASSTAPDSLRSRVWGVWMSALNSLWLLYSGCPPWLPILI